MGTGTIHFKNIGDEDNKEYIKVDMVKACRLGNNIALSFYQLDYQGMVNAMAGVSKMSPDEVKPMVISKLVMDYETFNRVKDEFDNLHTNMMQNKNGNGFQGEVN